MRTSRNLSFLEWRRWSVRPFFFIGTALCLLLPLMITAQQPQAQLLEFDKPIERELKNGESHSYQFTLRASQYLKAVIEQRGIDVVVRLRGADDKQIGQFDADIRVIGSETLTQVADADGIYRLDVQAKQAMVSGRYEIRIVELRTATDQDRALQEARQLYSESVRLYGAGKYDEARPLIERALDIREKTLGPDHADVATVLNNLGILDYLKGDSAKAERLFQRALTIREKALGGSHPDVAAALNSLANLYSGRGDYVKAEPLYLRALAIREESLGANHPAVVASLNNLAILYGEKGAYGKAEALYERALAIGEKTLGPDHPDLAFSLNNLAVVYAERGDYAKAEPLYRRALAIREKALGPDHPNLTRPLINLANAYKHKRDYNNAESLYQRALAISEKALAPDHPDIAYALENLAHLYFVKEDHGKAEPLYQRALTMFQKTLGPENREVADSLKNLAVLYSVKGDFAKGEPLYQQALAMEQKTQGPEHPIVADSLSKLAGLHAATDDFVQAIAYQTRAAGISEHNITLNTALGSERQKLAYLGTVSEESDQTISLHIQSAPDNSAARTLALNTVLLRKGRALDTMTDSVATLRRRASPADQALFDRLKDARSGLAQLVLGGPQRISPAQHQEQIKNLETQIEQLESEISLHSAEFRAQAEPPTTAAIQNAIPADAALVEFYIYRPFNPKYTRESERFGKPRYVVYVLPSRGTVQWVDLGDAAPIDRAVDVWRKALRDPNRSDIKSLARALDEQLMRPVRRFLGSTRNLLLSPDGALNLIPFGALVDEQNRYLIENYSLTYLTSGRDLLRLLVRTPSKQEPLVVANPRFDLRTSAVTNTAMAQQESRRSAIFLQQHFEALPGTGVEARSLKTVLPNARILTGAEATEASIKQVQGPSVLHIATHGFFLADVMSEKSVVSSNQPSTEHLYAEDPLLRSGLVLAGASQRQSGSGEDGILTAAEITGLDLWGTKLVVLSACDTGLGEVKNGEGVYGLRRALVLAGAESQVISLWEVADKPTRELMVGYYTGLQRGEGRSEALRKVQLTMLRSRDRRHPYYWAGFIESGEWANLAGRR